MCSANRPKGAPPFTLSDFQLLGEKKRKRGANTPNEIRAVMQMLGAKRKHGT